MNRYLIQNCYECKRDVSLLKPVFLWCSCEIFLCTECAYENIANQPNIWYDGICCPQCNTRTKSSMKPNIKSQFVLGPCKYEYDSSVLKSMRSAVLCAEGFMTGIFEKFMYSCNVNLKGGTCMGEEDIETIFKFFQMKNFLSLDQINYYKNKYGTLKQRTLLLSRIAQLYLWIKCNNIDKYLDSLPLSGLECISFSENRILSTPLSKEVETKCIICRMYFDEPNCISTKMCECAANVCQICVRTSIAAVGTTFYAGFGCQHCKKNGISIRNAREAAAYETQLIEAVASRCGAFQIFRDGVDKLDRRMSDYRFLKLLQKCDESLSAENITGDIPPKGYHANSNSHTLNQLRLDIARREVCRQRMHKYGTNMIHLPFGPLKKLKFEKFTALNKVLKIKRFVPPTAAIFNEEKDESFYHRLSNMYGIDYNTEEEDEAYMVDSDKRATKYQHQSTKATVFTPYHVIVNGVGLFCPLCEFDELDIYCNPEQLKAHIDSSHPDEVVSDDILQSLDWKRCNQCPKILAIKGPSMCSKCSNSEVYYNHDPININPALGSIRHCEKGSFDHKIAGGINYRILNNYEIFESGACSLEQPKSLLTSFYSSGSVRGELLPEDSDTHQPIEVQFDFKDMWVDHDDDPDDISCGIFIVMTSQVTLKPKKSTKKSESKVHEKRTHYKLGKPKDSYRPFTTEASRLAELIINLLSVTKRLSRKKKKQLVCSQSIDHFLKSLNEGDLELFDAHIPFVTSCFLSTFTPTCLLIKSIDQRYTYRINGKQVEPTIEVVNLADDGDAMYVDSGTIEIPSVEMNRMEVVDGRDIIVIDNVPPQQTGSVSVLPTAAAIESSARGLPSATSTPRSAIVSTTTASKSNRVQPLSKETLALVAKRNKWDLYAAIPRQLKDEKQYADDPQYMKPYTINIHVCCDDKDHQRIVDSRALTIPGVRSKLKSLKSAIYQHMQIQTAVLNFKSTSDHRLQDTRSCAYYNILKDTNFYLKPVNYSPPTEQAVVPVDRATVMAERQRRQNEFVAGLNEMNAINYSQFARRSVNLDLAVKEKWRENFTPGHYIAASRGIIGEIMLKGKDPKRLKRRKNAISSSESESEDRSESKDNADGTDSDDSYHRIQIPAYRRSRMVVLSSASVSKFFRNHVIVDRGPSGDGSNGHDTTSSNEHYSHSDDDERNERKNLKATFDDYSDGQREASRRNHVNNEINSRFSDAGNHAKRQRNDS